MDIDDVVAFEIIGRNADIRFYVSVPAKIIDLIEKPFMGIIPRLIFYGSMNSNIFSKTEKLLTVPLSKRFSYMPIRTYKDLPTDPLAALTSALSKIGEGGGDCSFLSAQQNLAGKRREKSYISSTRKSEENPKRQTL